MSDLHEFGLAFILREELVVDLIGVKDHCLEASNPSPLPAHMCPNPLQGEFRCHIIGASAGSFLCRLFSLVGPLLGRQ